MNLCPTCRLPISFHDDQAHCTATPLPVRRALAMAVDYRAALQLAPLDLRARSEMVAEVDEQIAFLEGLYA